MDLNELQKMISIIHDKKPRCRGNLRVKVLLKSTHDYVRRSLIDEQLGNPENLLTLLRNSGTDEPMDSVDSQYVHDGDHTYSALYTDTSSMDYNQISTVNNEHLESLRNSNKISENKRISRSKQNVRKSANKAVLQLNKCKNIFTNFNKNFKQYKVKEKYYKLTKSIRRILRHWDKLMSKVKSDSLHMQKHWHSIKKVKKLLLKSKVCFKDDFENQSFSQQKIIHMYVKIIRKMLKQCDNILDIN